MTMAARVRPTLWGITCFFNPNGSRRRLANYRAFRRGLCVPLVTVELAFGPQHELQRDDADILIPLRGRDLLWQKERLLNLALQALPKEADAIAWLDCDVLFERGDWPGRVCAELERCVLLQPFENVHDLAADMRQDFLDAGTPSRRSLASRIASGYLNPDLLSTARLRNEWGCAAGLAWAGRREVLDRHGFYDAGIVGGGDRAMACAAFGRWQGLEQTHQMNAQQQQHYLAWAKPFFDSVRGQVGFIDGGIVHLWHGNIHKRGYGTRFAGLTPFAFDPDADIALDDQGCWRWNSSKPELHQYVQRYFAGRNEDGNS